jgi:hypothetical protein
MQAWHGVQVSCLNEHSAGSCRSVFKPWEERTDFSGVPLQSCRDDAAELLLHIPCANPVLLLCTCGVAATPARPSVSI